MTRELNQFELEFEKRGFKIDNELPECEDHCSQMMWNSNGESEYVACTGNELAFIFVKA